MSQSNEPISTDANLALRSPAIRWDGDRLSLLDQRVLPAHNRYVECTRAGEVAAAIRDMVVRGAPAIGIAASYGVALAVREHQSLPATERAVALDAELGGSIGSDPELSPRIKFGIRCVDSRRLVCGFA